jgi:fatty acid desaturase
MLKKLKDVLVRFIGVILFAFIPGMAVGSPTVGWFWGGVNGVLTVAASIVVFFGVQLAWAATISHEDIEKGFRAAVAKTAADNEDVKAALKTSADEDGIDYADFDFGDLDELEGK